MDSSQHSVRGGWTSPRNFLSLKRNPSTDECLWCRYSDDGELKGVIGIHFDDFMIGLADGDIG